jgi:hypothetical protein
MLSSFVTNRQTAWLLYNEAQSWNTQPSKLLGVSEWYTAFCLDQAINYWGTFVSSELDKIEAKTAKATEAKRQARLQVLLSPEGEMPKGQFADPALMFA